MNSHQQKQQDDDSFLEIDPLQLDKEWIDQPRLYRAYAKKLATARLRLDEAKAELELIEAQLAKDIRDDPQKYDLGKVTDKAVESTIILQDEYQTAIEEMNNAKYKVGLLEATTTALDHRKRALEKLVDLTSMEWFSSPRASKTSKEAIDDIEKRAARTRGRRED